MSIVIKWNHCYQRRRIGPLAMFKIKLMAVRVDLATMQLLCNRKGSPRQISPSIFPYLIPLFLITYMYFLCISKVLSMFHHKSVG